MAYSVICGICGCTEFRSVHLCEYAVKKNAKVGQELRLDLRYLWAKVYQIATLRVLLLFFRCQQQRARGIVFSGCSAACPCVRVPQYLFTRWKDFHETWHRYSSCECALLKRFSKSGIKGQD